MQRAAVAAEKLDAAMKAFGSNGQLAEFNKEFRRRRMEATARGDSFMRYKNAFAKLKLKLAAHLSGGGDIDPKNLFAEVEAAEWATTMQRCRRDASKPLAQ